MRKILIMCAAICLVAFVSSAFAEVQNVKVSGDLEFLGVSRENFALGLATQGANNISTIQSIARVRIDADLTDNVSTTIRLLNERDWDAEGADTTDIDLDLAYVTLREMLYSPLTVTLGRQNLRFGNAMIVGDPDTNNQSAAVDIANADLSARKSFDAIRGTLDYDPLVIDVIYSKIDENTKLGVGLVGATQEEDDIDLYGINAAYDLGGEYNTMVEGYVFFEKNAAAKDVASNVVDPDQTGKSSTILCPGIRVSLNPIENLLLQTEVAMQFGNQNLALTSAGAQCAVANRDRKAMAAQVVAMYDFDMDYSPSLSLIYSWASGDKEPNDPNSESDYKAWDPMFEDQALGHIANAMFDNSNCHILKIEGALEPMDDVNLSLAWVGAWMDKKAGHMFANGAEVIPLAFFRQPGTAALTPVVMNVSENHICDEIDLTLTYDYTEDVQFKLLGAWLEPGAAIDDENSDAATELIASCKVLF